MFSLVFILQQLKHKVSSRGFHPASLIPSRFYTRIHIHIVGQGQLILGVVYESNMAYAILGRL